MDELSSEPLLAALLDGPFRRLRDDNHVDPHRILVWDEQQQPLIQALSILELLGRYPCGDGEEAQQLQDRERLDQRLLLFIPHQDPMMVHVVVIAQTAEGAIQQSGQQRL